MDVRGFQIAMNDSVLVRRLERVRDLLCDRQRLIERHRAARDPLRKILALDQFHDESTDTARFFKAVNVGDVGMIQGREGLRFACEPGKPFGVTRKGVRQDFDSDVAIQPGVSRAKHFAHAADAKLGDDLVLSESSAGAKGQIAVYYIGGTADGPDYSP